MIIPTPKFDPMFADDGVPFAEKMTSYIEREFADFPGLHQHLLKVEQGQVAGVSAGRNPSLRIDPPEKILGPHGSTQQVRDRAAR